MNGLDFTLSEAHVRLVEGIRFITLDIELLEIAHRHYDI